MFWWLVVVTHDECAYGFSGGLDMCSQLRFFSHCGEVSCRGFDALVSGSFYIAKDT